MQDSVRQKTVHSSASIAGVALHSGCSVKLRLRPAPSDTGVVFNRTDVAQAPAIEALASNVTDTSRATTLGAGQVVVGTVEHLLSALRGLGVDNVYVDVDGPELPALDGSSRPYIELIKRAGLRPQRRCKKVAVIRERVEVQDAGRWAVLRPARSFSVKCTIDFDHPLIGEQATQLDFSQVSYEREIAGARTFAFFREVQWLREQGLALGGSLDNCIVVDEEQILNKGGLRFDDEFVRHKVLDAVGDLALFGMPIIGEFESFKSGHAVHKMLLDELLRRPQAYEVIELEAEEHLSNQGLSLPDWAPVAEPAAA